MLSEIPFDRFDPSWPYVALSLVMLVFGGQGLVARYLRSRVEVNSDKIIEQLSNQLGRSQEELRGIQHELERLRLTHKSEKEKLFDIIEGLRKQLRIAQRRVQLLLDENKKLRGGQ